MNYYSKDKTNKIHNENFEFIKFNQQNHLITITLNRPQKRNAIHPQTINELAFLLQYIHYEKKIRVIVLESSGSVFCSGLDLDAIYGKAEAHNSSIPNSKKKILLGQILTEVHKPIISKVEGNVYAGGYIYLACSTYVIASDDLEFSLPEVKRGIFPMQGMGLLMRIMTPRNIIDWCIRGYSLSAKKAKKWASRIWDVNPSKNDNGSYPILHDKGSIGGLLKGFFGYNGDPSLIELIAWLFSVIGLNYLYKKFGKSKIELLKNFFEPFPKQ